LVRRYADGAPVDELAARFKVDQSTVQKHARRRDLPRRSPRLGPNRPRKQYGCIWPGNPWPSCQSTSVSLLTRWLSPYAGTGSRCGHDGVASLAARSARSGPVALTKSESVIGWGPGVVCTWLQGAMYRHSARRVIWIYRDARCHPLIGGFGFRSRDVPERT
jgi:hypothetical protein